MFKKNLKRFVAIMLTATMVIGTTAMAFAADPEYSQAGDIEGWVNKKIFSVLVPTASNNALKMLVDPQGLIKATEAAAKEGLSDNDFEAGATVLFPRTTGTYKYAAESESISMANVGTVSVNYSLTAKVEELGGIALSGNGADYNNTTDKAVLYIEMKKGTLPTYETVANTSWATKSAGSPTTTDGIIVSGNGISVAVSADVVPTVRDLYEVSWNSVDKYTYGIPKTSVSTAKVEAYKNNSGGLLTTSFIGKTNNGDLKAWKDVTAAKPKLTLTYTFTKIDPDADAQDLPSDGKQAYAVFTQNNFWLGSADGVGIEGLTSTSQVSKFTINGVNVLSKATVQNGFLKVTWTDASSLGLTAASKFTIDATIDGNDYTASIVMN